MKNILKLVFFLTVAFSVNNSFSQESKSDAIRVIEAKLISAQEMSNNNVLSILDGKREVYLLSQLGDIKELCDKHNIPLPERYSYLYFRYHIMKIEDDNSCQKKFSEHYERAYYFGKEYLDKTSNSSKAATLERRSEITFVYLELHDHINMIEKKRSLAAEAFELKIGILDTITNPKTLSSFLEKYCEPCKNEYSLEIIYKDGERGKVLSTTAKIKKKLNELEIIEFDFSDKTAFEKAKKENSVNAYNSYLNNFPNGKYLQEAQNSINDINTKKENKKAWVIGREKGEATFLTTNFSSVSWSYFVPVGKDRKWKNFAFGGKIIEYLPFNEYKMIDYSIGFGCPDIYLSPANGGTGFFIKGGFDGWTINKTNRNFFLNNTSSSQNTDPKTLKIQRWSWRYGIGYQNVLPNGLFLGITYEWSYDVLESEAKSSLNFSGFKEKHMRSSLVLSLGLGTYDGRKKGGIKN
jgi:hypothetical protein